MRDVVQRGVVMAQPGVYRDGMQCPRCGSNWLPKYGKSRGKQRYRCQQCLYHFTLDAEHPHQPERVKNLAVAMYAEGNSIEAIGRMLGRMLGMKAGTVCSWVKKAYQARNLLRVVGEQRRDRRRGQRLPRVISFDEMWSYVGGRRQEKRLRLAL